MMKDLSMPYIINAQLLCNNSLEFLINYAITNQEKIKECIAKYGAVLYRGFEVNNLEHFEHFVSSLPGCCTSYIGGDSPRTKLTQKVYTSTEYPADQSIVLHNELTFSNNYPQFLYFFCHTPPTYRGETPLADNRELYRRLPKTLIQKYQKKKLKYIMNLHNGQGIGKSWQEVFETSNMIEVEKVLNKRGVSYCWKDKDNLQVIEVVQPVICHPRTKEWVFISQAHQWHPSNLEKDIYESLLSMMPETEFYHYVCYGDDEPLDINELELTKKIIDTIKVETPWQKSDILFIDNLLTMHGRNSFKGERKVLVMLIN